MSFFLTSPAASSLFKQYCNVLRDRLIARVAAGADLLDTAYQILKNRTPYYFADAARHKRKMAELHRMAAAKQGLSVS